MTIAGSSATDSYLLPLLSVVSTVITLALFLSPWTTFKEILAKKSVGNLSCTPFILSLLNCVLWIGYATIVNNAVVQFVNAVGTVTSIYYVFVFYNHSLPLQKEKLNYHIGAAALFLIVTALYISYSGENAAFRLGAIASVVSIFMFAAPLEKMFLVITTKSTESMESVFKIT